MSVEKPSTASSNLDHIQTQNGPIWPNSFFSRPPCCAGNMILTCLNCLRSLMFIAFRDALPSYFHDEPSSVIRAARFGLGLTVPPNAFPP